MKCFLHTLPQKIKKWGYKENKSKTKKNIIFLFDLYLEHRFISKNYDLPN